MKRLDFLRDLVVLDMTRLLPGPFATLRLADMGADVIRIEDPQIGDYARSLPPLARETGHLYLTLNRNKQSLAVDIKIPEGAEVVRHIARGADVLIESYRPGVLTSFGLDAESLRKINPGIVYCSLTGYGQESSLAGAAGHDLNYLAMTGILDGCGRPGEPPSYPGIPIADLAGGMAAVEAILAALYRREGTGEGAFIDLAMTDVLLSWSAFSLSMHRGGVSASRGGHLANGAIVGYQIHETSDGRHVALSALEPKFWNRFCDAVQRPEWKNRGTVRVEDDPALHREVAELFRSRSRDEWEQLASTADCCLTPVYTLEESIASPLASERNAFVEMDIPGEGRQIVMNTGYLTEASTTGAESTPPPRWGEHTRPVLKRFGYTDDEIDALAGRKVLFEPAG